MNIIQVDQAFPTEFDVVRHFEAIRWGKKPRCGYCRSAKLLPRSPDQRFYCKECQRSSFVTAGTHLAGTRIPLKTWLYAFSIVSDAKKGLSALQLQRNLNLSYPTAFKMYHKIREIMAVENRQIAPLDNVVEMDETFIGGKPRKPNNPVLMADQRLKLDRQVKDLKSAGFSFAPLKGNPAKVDLNVKRGRGSQKMVPVVGIVQRDSNVVAEVMQSLTHANLKKMVKKYVDEDESVLITDTYSGYNKLDQIIEHVKIDHSTSYSYKGINTNTIEGFWAIVKRGIVGQYHAVSLKYLPNYISEFVFKYNNRRVDDMFETLVFNALQTPTPTSL